MQIVVDIEKKHALILTGLLLLLIGVISAPYVKALTQHEVIQRSPAYHLLKDIYTQMSGEYVPLATTTGKINASLIEGKVAEASQADYALNADKLDGKDWSSIGTCPAGKVLRGFDSSGNPVCVDDQNGISTCSDCASIFVNRGGDTMSGDLNMQDNSIRDANLVETNVIADPEDTIVSVTDNLEATGYIRGSQLCIGTDCRSSWPSGGSQCQWHTITFTSSTTWTVPDGVYWIYAILQGGGGGGGGGSGVGTTYLYKAGGGGGGAGATVITTVPLPVTPGTSITITVGKGGAGGAGGVYSGGNGGDGGDTKISASTFGTLIARGGKGGRGANEDEGGAGGNGAFVFADFGKGGTSGNAGSMAGSYSGKVNIIGGAGGGGGGSYSGSRVGGSGGSAISYDGTLVYGGGRGGSISGRYGGGGGGGGASAFAAGGKGGNESDPPQDGEDGIYGSGGGGGGGHARSYGGPLAGGDGGKGGDGFVKIIYCQYSS